MRNLLIIIVILGLLSCTQTVKEKVKVSDLKDSTSVLSADIEPQFNNNRENIIIEINNLSDAIAKKDKATLLNFFDFPLSDSIVNFFEVDRIFDAKRKLNDGITMEMFNESFDKIYEQTDMPEFNNLFRYLNTNDLEHKDHINYKQKVKDDCCVYLYSITIKENEVYFNYGTNFNDDYRKTHPDEEDICDEYAQNWMFVFNGKHLKFVRHRIAG